VVDDKSYDPEEDGEDCAHLVAVREVHFCREVVEEHRGERHDAEAGCSGIAVV